MVPYIHAFLSRLKDDKCVNKGEQVNATQAPLFTTLQLIHVLVGHRTHLVAIGLCVQFYFFQSVCLVWCNNRTSKYPHHQKHRLYSDFYKDVVLS